jgi:PEP-CTERM motif
MKFATTFAAMMIAGVLPLASASLPASAKVFDWSRTGPAPDLGGVPFPGVGHFTLTLVPEPSTWALMLIGFAGLGVASYRATRKGADATA